MHSADGPLRRDAFNRVGESAFSPLPHQMMSDESIATKVAKGVLLGVAQTLGTEYFPAAYDRRLYLLSCFAERYVK